MKACGRVLVVLLALGSGLCAVARELPMARRFLQQGNNLLAVRFLEEVLEEDPDDGDAHALLGVARAQQGRYSEAAVHFTLAQGSERYEAGALELHASTLRYVEGGRGAAPLRQAIWLSSPEAGDDFLYQLSLVDDHLAAGEAEAAELAGWEAVGIKPESPAAHTFLAEALLEGGHLAEVEAQLWLASKEGYPIARTGVVEARLGLLRGDLQLARAGVDLGLLKDRWNPRVVAVHLRVLLLEGQVDTALEVAQRPRNKLQHHPELLAARLRVLHSLSSEDPDLAREAEELRLLLAGAHAHLPDVAGALADTRSTPHP